MKDARDKGTNIIRTNRVSGEDEMQDKKCRINTLNSGFIERARVEGKKKAEFPAARKQVAWEAINDERAQLSLEQVGGVKR